jgi:hypothetical protein
MTASLHVICAGVLLAAASVRAGEIQARLMYSLNEAQQPPRIELTFSFYKDGHPLMDCLRKTPEVTRASNYEVVALKGGTPVPFDIEKVSAPGAPWCSEVILRQKAGQTLSSDVVYTARVKDPSIWQFRDGDQPVSGFVYASRAGAPQTDAAPSDPAALKLNEQWLTKTFAYENKVAIGAGGHGGTASLSWRLFVHDDPTDYATYDSWRLEFSAEADLNFPSKSRHDFFDQVHAEGNYFWSNRWGKSGDAWRLYADLGAHGLLEADQSFDNIDGGGGALLRWTLGNPLTDYLANSLPDHPNPLLGPHHVLVVSPMFSVGYNYVSHIKQDTAADAGNNRLDATFFWRWPLAREMKWQRMLGVNASYDLDLRIELGGVWDLDRGDVHDMSRISLELAPTERLPDADATDLPTITITYGNGEISPRYEHIQEWLAGFKYAF